MVEVLTQPRQKVGGEFPRSRPTTFDLLARAAVVSGCFGNPFSIQKLNEVLNKASLLRDPARSVDGLLIENFGAEPVLGFKLDVHKLVDDSQGTNPLIADFPELVRRSALRWSNQGLQGLEQLVQAERREQKIAALKVHRIIHQPWSRTGRGDVPRGPGSYSKERETSSVEASGSPLTNRQRHQRNANLDPRRRRPPLLNRR